jgi:dCTP deaminase
MILNDRWIARMAREHRMIEPFVPSLMGQGTISYGLSSFGYDFRLAGEFRVPTGDNKDRVLDPKKTPEDLFAPYRGQECIIPANSYVLGRSLEYFRIPRSVLALCTGKSTYARCGVVVNVTPLEPEWEGFITVSIANTAPWPVKVYAGEGLGQIVFFEGEPPKVSYADRKGKYQSQQGLTLPRI